MTRIDDLWKSLLHLVLCVGHDLESRAGACKEKIGVSCKLHDIEHNFVTNQVRNLDPVYASAELLWYLSGTNDISMLKHYAPSYANFAQADGTAYGAYGYRIIHGLRVSTGEMINESLLNLAYHELKDHPVSRQCVITLWHPVDLANAYDGKMKDVPCTISWQFLRRQEKLHMVCNMRSNDLWLGFPYDVYVNTTIQRMLAGELGLDLGSYTHNVGSMHLYERNYEKARMALDAPLYAVDMELKHGYTPRVGGFRGLDSALEVERASRERATLTPGEQTRPSEILWDAAEICVSGNNKRDLAMCNSKLLFEMYARRMERRKK